MRPTKQELSDLNTVLRCIGGGYEAREALAGHLVTVYRLVPGARAVREDYTLRYEEAGLSSGWSYDDCGCGTCETTPPEPWLEAARRLAQGVMDDLLDAALFATAAVSLPVTGEA